MGLANRLTRPAGCRARERLELAHQLAGVPAACMRSDRRSSYEQWDLPIAEAMANETTLGLTVIESGETQAGAARFADGDGRHGAW